MWCYSIATLETLARFPLQLGTTHSYEASCPENTKYTSRPDRVQTRWNLHPKSTALAIGRVSLPQLYIELRNMEFVIIGIDVNKYIADTEQKTGCECSTQRLIGSTFFKKRRLKTLWHSKNTKGGAPHLVPGARSQFFPNKRLWEFVSACRMLFDSCVAYRTLLKQCSSIILFYRKYCRPKPCCCFNVTHKFVLLPTETTFEKAALDRPKIIQYAPEALLEISFKYWEMVQRVSMSTSTLPR